jgi:5-methylcytosine-specific restriction endonuclease McrA
MPTDSYYFSKEWKALRNAALARDRWTCIVPGCSAGAVVVDHIVPRRYGGSNSLSNIRCLCRVHDNQIKERPGGFKRGNAGKLSSPCDVNGYPLDPTHPWFRKRVLSRP